MRSAPTRDEIRNALLPDSKKERFQDDGKVSSSPSIIQIYRTFEDEQKRNELERYNALLRKKRCQRELFKFLEKYWCYVFPAMTLTVAGGTFGLLWKYYYLEANNHLLELDQIHNNILASYNDTHCPEADYWYHPEQQALCRGGYEGPYHSPLLYREDYCLASNCISVCHLLNRTFIACSLCGNHEGAL